LIIAKTKVPILGETQQQGFNMILTSSTSLGMVSGNFGFLKVPEDAG